MYASVSELCKNNGVCESKAIDKFLKRKRHLRNLWKRREYLTTKLLEFDNEVGEVIERAYYAEFEEMIKQNKTELEIKETPSEMFTVEETPLSPSEVFDMYQAQPTDDEGLEDMDRAIATVWKDDLELRSLRNILTPSFLSKLGEGVGEAIEHTFKKELNETVESTVWEIK